MKKVMLFGSTLLVLSVSTQLAAPGLTSAPCKEVSCAAHSLACW